MTAIKDEAIRLVSILPELFGDDLDRKTLWERIGNGLVVCSQKAGGDWESFVNFLLEYIKADPGAVAANKNLEGWVGALSTKPKEWREVFLRIIEKKHMLIVLKGRNVWNINKRSAS
jgi:hypothetical protein